MNEQYLQEIYFIENLTETGKTVTDLFLIFYQAAVAIKISNLLICFCSFDLS